MRKQVTATIVVFLFCLLYTVAIVAQERDGNESGNGANARAEVGRLGFGQRVNVKLKNGAKATGRLTGFANEHFVVTDSKGEASTIAYSEVSRISRQKEKQGIFHAPWTGIMFTAAGVGTLVIVAMNAFN